MKILVCAEQTGEHAMSIRFNCPNGHAMNVKDKYAGRWGLCPTCQAHVLVPIPAGKLTEDAVVGILGPPPAPDPDDLAIHQDVRHASGGPDAGSSSGVSLKGIPPLHRGMKVCPKCKREVRAVYDICPHCRTYFTDVTEVSRRMALTCKQCGTEYEHHEIIIWCRNCGADLRQQV